MPAVAGGGVAWAQASESKEARAKRVIDEAIAALGGAKFSTMRDSFVRFLTW